MKKVKYLILSLGMVFGLCLTVLPATVGAAIDPLGTVCSGDAAQTALCKNKDSKKNSFSYIVGVIVNTLLFLVAAVSVVMIIIGGIYYTTSNGDASLVKKAKDTIMYSVIGLIVAIMAYAIVNFVITAFK
ncbi:MAG: hypothetical protein NTV39_00085 [Candidatus Saccharibacteria bacterium]|nr:hypothetical protein [Candidatus Saccharibacteria bacterium]